MTITLDSFTFSRLNAQPFSYDSVEVVKGYTARQWTISGLATPSEWLDLLSLYDTWRDLRVEDEDSLTSGNTGTVVVFSGNGPGGQTWSNIDCWFTEPPNAQQVGAWLSISFVIVDSNQSLQILQKNQDTGGTTDELPDFGTITIDDTTLTLLKPPDAYLDGPKVELTAAGTQYISGALSAFKIKDIEGTTNLAGWDNIRAWYEEQAVSIPISGSYYPTTPPSAKAEIVYINGVKTTVYTVQIQLILID